jgi:glycosyltransferase involved in cell wall biosynthesis
MSALKQLSKRQQNCLLVLVGDGPYKSHLMQQVIDLGLKDKVRFAGLRPHHEIATWINAADLVVHPSLNEGSPLPIYEALACGKPMVATSVGGIPELVSNQDYALLVPPADSEALAAALFNGLHKTWNPKKLSAYGKNYTWENVANQLRQLYRDVLETRVYKNRYSVGSDAAHLPEVKL